MKYRVILRKIKSTTQAIEIAKFLSKEFSISQEKAYSFIKKAPLTIFNKIDEEKLNLVEDTLQNLDAIYEVEEIGFNTNQHKISDKNPIDTIEDKKVEKEKINGTFLLLLAFVIALFISSIAMFAFFYFQKYPLQQKTNIENTVKTQKSKKSFTNKLKSFLASDYSEDEILQMVFDGKFEQTQSILFEKFKKKGDDCQIFKQLGILYFTWAYSDGNREKWENYGKNLDDLWDDKKINKSLDFFEKSLSMNEKDHEVINYIGVIFYEKGWYKRSEKMYKQAIALLPSYIEAHSNLGILQNSLGDLEEAEKTFENIIKMDKEYKNAYLNLALVCNRLKKSDKAIFYLKNYVEFRPADENLFSAIQLLKNLEKEKK